MNPLDKVLRRLDKVRSTSRDGWMARCPAHNDSTPSLSVDTGEDGRVLLNCFAGCSKDKILRSLGLEWSDLFPDKRGVRR